MSKAFMCLLHPNAPAPLLEMLAGYLRGAGEMKFFFCSSIKHGTFFVEFGIQKRREDNPWLVSIPPQYILAVAETGEDAPVGFRSD